MHNLFHLNVPDFLENLKVIFFYIVKGLGGQVKNVKWEPTPLW